jgi:hypothetical protein
MASSLNGDGQLTLVKSAGTVDSSGKNLSALADALSESGNVLIVDVLDLIGTELADLSMSLIARTEGLLLRLSLLGLSLGLIVIHLTYLLL